MCRWLSRCSTASASCRRACLILHILLFLPACAHAGIRKTLVDFDPAPMGAEPSGNLVRGRDGLFYGVAEQGGPGNNGLLFKMSDEGAVAVAHAFTKDEGYPSVNLTQDVDGNIYGIAGPNVYKVAPGGEFSILHTFDESEGGAPKHLTYVSDGSLYGVAINPDDSETGAFFRMTTAGEVTVLHTFRGGDWRMSIHGFTEGNDGALYGTTDGMSRSDAGTVFKATKQGELTTLYSFNGTDGRWASGRLALGHQGRLFGATASGGANDRGEVFKLAPNGAMTVLHSFRGPDGDSPEGGLVLAGDGNFYGVTSEGGAFAGPDGLGAGVVYRVSPSGKVELVYSFRYTDGANPRSTLLRGPDGVLYGTTSQGGTNGNGTVFKITTAGKLTVLSSFPGHDPARPAAELLEAVDGALYGVSEQGGEYGLGTIFKVTRTGDVTILHSFKGSDGATPQGGLVAGKDGILYGTASEGGATSGGVVFKMTPDGALTVLHAFTEDEGTKPMGSLVLADNGDLYGTASRSGDRDAGAIFKVSPDGVFTVMHRFHGTDGAVPQSGLIMGKDGNLYGTTSFDRIQRNKDFSIGVIFTMTPAGDYTIMHAVRGNDGFELSSGLATGDSGLVFGVSWLGGQQDGGTAFICDRAGRFNVLHAFNSDEEQPASAMVRGRDGALYGVTSRILYRISATGAFSVLERFGGDYSPDTPLRLTLGSDGYLYAPMAAGGAHGYGGIVRWDIGTAPDPGGAKKPAAKKPAAKKPAAKPAH